MRALGCDLCEKMLLERCDAPAIQAAHQRHHQQPSAD